MQDYRDVLVWELPVRLFHWAIVLLICASWTSAELDEMDWHIRFGLASFGLLAFRLIWGIIGGESARFTRFVASPRRVIAYLRQGFAPQPDQEISHNPAGGWMVIAMLAGLILQVCTGLFASDDIAAEGPLSHLVPSFWVKKLTFIHSLNFFAICALAALHIAAVVFYRVKKGQNLVRPMITGHKQLPAGIAPPAPAPLWLAALLFCVIGAATWWLAQLGG